MTRSGKRRNANFFFFHHVHRWLIRQQRVQQTVLHKNVYEYSNYHLVQTSFVYMYLLTCIFVSVCRLGAFGISTPHHPFFALTILLLFHPALYVRLFFFLSREADLEAQSVGVHWGNHSRHCLPCVGYQYYARRSRHSSRLPQ